MLDYAMLEELGKEVGFTAVVPLDVSTIECKDKVREMCAADKCQRYGHTWTCPPVCGTLDEMRERLKPYSEGILVQTMGEVEDSMDFEGIGKISMEHNESFFKLQKLLKEKFGSVLPVPQNGCARCKKCTYPDEPCRFPDEAGYSMSAFGMLVLEVCKLNNLQYYYGSDHMAFTSCFLIKE